MSDPIVNAWRQQGKLYLWRNPSADRNLPGWDCAMDESARQSLIELCERMLSAKFDAKRMISIAPFSADVAQLPGSAVTNKFFSPAKFTIIYPLAGVLANQFHWSGEPAQPVLTIGQAKLKQLKEALEKLAEYGDFCIHADDQKLHGFDFEKSSIWFWQLFDTTFTTNRHLPRNH